MDLYKELIEIVNLLKKNRIEYALCGGMAVAFHGYPRFTGDIDILLKKEDLSKIREVLKKIDYTIATGPLPFEVNTANPREVHRISKIDGDEVITLDILIVNHPLEGVWESREVFSIDDIEITVVSREGLLKMKRIAGRDQDLLDIKKLEEDIDKNGV